MMRWPKLHRRLLSKIWWSWWIKVKLPVFYQVHLKCLSIAGKFYTRRNHNTRIFDTLDAVMSRHKFRNRIFAFLIRLKNMIFVDVKRNFRTIRSCRDFVQVFLEALPVTVRYWIFDICIVFEFCSEVVNSSYIIYAYHKQHWFKNRTRSWLVTNPRQFHRDQHFVCYCLASLRSNCV